MKARFCPSCGKETKELVEGLCKGCFKERKGLYEIPALMKLEVCKRCGRFKLGGEWKDIGYERTVKEKLKEAVAINSEVEDFTLEVEALPERGRCTVKGEGKVKGVKLKERKNVQIKLEKATCRRCSKISSGYYEAVVQIRGEDEKVEEALKISREALQSSRDRKAFLSDWEEVKSGVDLFVGSKSVARKIAKEISSKYKTETKSSKSLYGEENGQKKYRSTYLVRILE